jgi:hypothetical protein
MKNYLVKSLYQVVDPDWKVVNRSHEEDLYQKYQAMHQLSLASYQRFLGGTWELKFFEGDVDNINQAFERTFWAIHDLWHSEPCNILYTDPDTMAVKVLNPWGQYPHFTMFNYTDPRSFDKPNRYNKQFDHFFNAGVRYFPSTMSRDIWASGAEMARNWDYETYDTEQIILNTMLWDQPVQRIDVLNPYMAYQAFHPDIRVSDQWNGLRLGDAGILHFHSSRDAQNRLEIMSAVAKQTGII